MQDVFIRRWIRLVETEPSVGQRWVHFSNHPMVQFNTKGFHQDPLGIYLFPADHVPAFPIWHEMAYKFTAVLKPGARVLDLASITDEQLDTLMALTGAREKFDAYIAQYPPVDRNKMMRMAWEMMRMHYMRSVPAAWTKALMTAGWDAVNDDIGVIHSSEPLQLIVLNPRVLKIVDMQRQKMPVFAAMKKVAEDVAKLASEFAPTTIEGPRKVKERYGNKWILEASVRAEKSDKNYCTFAIHYQDEKGYRTKINASVRYAWPPLNAGFGATFDMIKGEYDSYSNLDQLRRALTRVFAETEE